MSSISLDPKIEKRIIEEARKEKAKFGPLYKHYKKYIFEFFTYRVEDYNTAEELTSVVFEKALKGLDNFQWQGVPFSAWLYRIARNTLIDHYRKKAKNKEISSLELIQELPSKEKQPHEIVETMFTEELLYNILQELPSREKEIIYLKFFDGYTNKIIAEITSLSETNVGTILYRTIRKLRELYRENAD